MRLRAITVKKIILASCIPWIYTTSIIYSYVRYIRVYTYISPNCHGDCIYAENTMRHYFTNNTSLNSSSSGDIF